jgi:hypothetical protein
MDEREIIKQLLFQLKQCDEWIREAVTQGCSLPAAATLRENQRVINKAEQEGK